MFSKSLFLSLLLSTHLLFAAFEVRLSSTNIGLDDTLELTIECDIPGGAKVYSQDFGLISQSSSSSLTVDGSGRHLMLNTDTYILKPNKVGKCVLQVQAGNERKPPFEINVVAGSVKTVPGNNDGETSEPPKPTFPGYGTAFDNGILIKQVLNKKSLRLYEPAILEIYLYAKIPFGGIQPIKWESLEGIVAEPFEFKQPPPKKVILQGVPYNEYLIHKRVIYPNLSGNRKIEGAILRVEAEMVQKRGPFSFRTGVPADIPIPPIELEVKGFPTKRPKTFTSAVGEFSYRVTQDKKKVNAHDPVTVTLEITGRGNFKAIALPTFEPQNSDIVVRKSTLSAKEDFDGTTWQGTKKIEYYLFPKKEGNIKIAPPSFSYWSLKNNDFIEVNPQPISIAVGPPTDQEASLILSTDGTVTDIYDSGIRFIKSPQELTRFKSFPFRPLFILGHLFSLALLIGAIFFRQFLSHKLKHSSHYRMSGAMQKFKKKCSKILAITNIDEGVAALEQVLHFFITDRLNISHGSSIEEIRNHLDAKGLTCEQGNAILVLLKKLQSWRYNPERESKSITELITESLNLAGEFESAIGSKPTSIKKSFI